jgi:hypothetical protein
MALLITIAQLLMWFAQGVGLLQWFAPHLRRDSVVGWILATWLGLIANVVVVMNLYFLLPITIHQIAWPVAVGLSAISLSAYARSPRPLIRVEPIGVVVLVLSGLATILVLRPLVSHHELGFFFYSDSINAELANYSAFADIVQFHDSATTIKNADPLTTRESTVGALCAIAATLTGKAAVWVTQPVVAAFAALAFSSLGLLFRHFIAKLRLGYIASLVVAAIYAWAIMSESAQYFWSQSYASQYLSIALFFGALVFLFEARELPSRRRILILGLLAAALLFAYPEMFVPSLGLLGAFELVSSDDRARAAIRVIAVAAIALVVTNHFAVEMFTKATTVNPAGWNVYGSHHPILGFISNLLGFANPYEGPVTCHPAWSIAASVAFVIAAGFAVLRLRSTDVNLRGLSWLFLLFLVGVALLFGLIVRRGNGPNYAAAKFILGFGWLGYLLLGAVLGHLMRWRPQVLPPIAMLVIGLWIGLVPPALHFTKKLHQTEKTSLYLEHEGERCREVVGSEPFVSSSSYHYFIVGEFLARGRDVSRGQWPGVAQRLESGQPILLIGNAKLADDPQIRTPYRERCRGRNFTVYTPDNAPEP